MNKWIGVGRLTKDPEIRVNGEKTIGRTSMAINMTKDRVEFVNITAFDRRAEMLEKYFRKGDRIGIAGSIHNSSYKNKDGQKVNTTEIWVDEIEILKDRKTDDDYGIPEEVEKEELPF